MKCSVYSLARILFQGEAVSVNCKTKAGDITVLPHHRPLISILEAGTITIKDENGKDHYLPVTSGFIHVEPEDRVQLIVDENEKASSR